MKSKTESFGWNDTAPHTADYLHVAIRKIASDVRPADILDAGCGNGALAADLARAGYAVTGVDGDAGGIEQARATYPGIRFEVALFDSDPTALQATPDGQFDMVVSTEVVEHLYSPQELPEFCFAALRPGGTVAISTPYHGYVKNLVLAVTGKWDSHFTVLWHGGHIKFWSRKTLTHLLTEAGLSVTGFVGVGRFPYLWKSMIIIARKPD